MLSPRIIHFTEQELRWECNANSLCECSTTERPFDGCRKKDLTALTSDFDWHIKWHEIVQDYTQKSLTYSNDIFPALQGLAKKGSSVLGNYLAGLWESTLIYSLTWYRYQWSGTPLLPRPQSWRAPTWSWASIAGAVKFSQHEGNYSQTFATIISADTTAVGDDRTGELSDGWLVIKGMCVTGLFQFYWHNTAPHHSTPAIGIPQLPDPSHSYDPDYGILERQNNTTMVAYYSFMLDYDTKAPGPYHVPVGTKVLLMKVDEIGEQNTSDRTRSWLVLREMDPEKKVYERIGVIKMRLFDPHVAVMESWYADLAQEMEVTLV
jgi:hypothetical protein